MNVARLNMSHGTHQEHRDQLDAVRAAAEAAQRPIGVFADLQGPKIRLGEFDGGTAQLSYGATFTITTEDIIGDAKRCSTTHKGLPSDVQPGDLILIDDGQIQLNATEVTDTDVICKVKVGGPVSDHKGINLPGVAVGVPALSEKDRADLRWALQQQVDMIAMSFIRDPTDITDARQIMAEEGRTVPIIAKIEKPQAVQNLDGLIETFDAFMVARGDLGVEMPLEEVPLVQKRIVNAARRAAKPVIVATQMLESMASAPRPTRAEASDVANAVLDGADAVMLSGETSVGQYPVITVETMARIITETEAHGMSEMHPLQGEPHTPAGVITKAAAEVAAGVGARCLAAFTQSGDTARRLLRLRSPISVLAFTPLPSTQAVLTLSWGVESILVPVAEHTDDMFKQVDRALIESGRVSEGEQVVIVAGSPPGRAGATNLIRLRQIGQPV
jgi:pyruvate kinase